MTSSIARASRARDTAATCTQSTGGRSRATSLFDSRSDRRERRERRRSPEEILSTTHRDLREQTLCLAPGEPAGLPSVAVLSSEERGPMAPFRRPQDGCTEDVVRSVIRITTLGLRHCHRQGIAHRDVKPENVLVICQTPSLFPSAGAAEFGTHHRSNLNNQKTFIIVVSDKRETLGQHFGATT